MKLNTKDYKRSRMELVPFRQRRKLETNDWSFQHSLFLAKTRDMSKRHVSEFTRAQASVSVET